MSSPYNPRDCFESWAEEVYARSQRIRKLIGNKHWLSDGTHKEFLIREFLNRHLCPSYTLSKGFVVDIESGSSSKEIDIIVSNFEKDVPIYSESDFHIVPPRALCAQIHVKTEFDTKELTDVFKSSIQCNSLINSSFQNPFSAGVFFEKSHIKENQDYIKKIASALNNIDATESSYLPDVLCIINGPIFKKQGDHTYIGFSSGQLSLLNFLAALDERIAVLNTQSQNTSISTLSRVSQFNDYTIIK